MNPFGAWWKRELGQGIIGKGRGSEQMKRDRIEAFVSKE